LAHWLSAEIRKVGVAIWVPVNAIYGNIYGVPNKVRIFGWQVYIDALATKKNKWQQTLENSGTCDIRELA
jgi:hypothetical protein